uniref:Amino AcidPolyamineOrganocation (APC) Family putati n=1 Tax=Albugo laibachii Nc14 TaxID=890382 RepID=F0WNF1_9STRA|nr:Amino AcidPolyamineOrganocation (APC) Family putati [Albugo laibachii Nc14]|eukprot:CCA22842.1 Amino AcidPolyamineOrganocation (APC) Family putati [Albugo laibachii Nc14]
MTEIPTRKHHPFIKKPMHIVETEESLSELSRSLSLFDLVCIGIGGTVGSGIFATAGTIISETAGPAAVVSWIIGGVVVCINSLAYMELTTRIPSSGSTYAYVYHTLGEAPAIVAAWLLTLEYGVSGAGVARSWAEKVADWIASDRYEWLNLEYTNVLGALLQASCVLILLSGFRCGKLAINSITITKCLIVMIIIVAGMVALRKEYLSPFLPPRDTVTKKYGYQGVITGAAQAFFGYIGFDEVCCLAAEAKNPRKIMPLAVIIVVLATMFLSVAASFVLSGLLPFERATSFSAGFENVGWKWAASIIRLGEIVTMPVVVLVCFLAQPRLNYAVACDGLLFRIFAKIDGNGNMFWNTLITGTLLTILAFTVPFTILWDIVSFGILLSFIMSNTAVLMVRTMDISPRLAPRYICVIVVSAGLAAFIYQKGYEDAKSEICLLVALLLLTITLVMTVIFAWRCPQGSNDMAIFSAPFVPYLPSLAIVLDWYLIAQLSTLPISLGCAWILAALLSYLAYGFHHAASRTGWARLRNQQVNEVKSQIESMADFREFSPIKA